MPSKALQSLQLSSTISGGGILPYGYLGVDIFFVVGGFLLIRSLMKQFKEGTFNYWNFIFRKIIRLWPLVILGSIISVCGGYFLMLPDDYENLAESAIASSVFANNILQCITTKNYWDIVNLYKPLMHLWYVGLLMQAYIVLPLIFMILVKLTKNSTRGIKIGIIGLTMVSFALFLMPQFSTAWKFYYLPFRLFEITAGGILLLFKPRMTAKCKSILGWGGFFILLFLLCTRWEILSGSIMLICTVIGILIYIVATEEQEQNGFVGKLMNVGAVIGKRSYSIYIWHQIIVAFLFYSLFPKQNVVSFLSFAALTMVISLFSYRFIEVPLGKIIGKKGKETVAVVVTGIFMFLLCGTSFLIYRNAGVVRDVPELDVYRDNVRKGMHAEYCDRPYAWDNDFDESIKKRKILVIGNSFGRDWANILYEWDSKDELEISYLYFTGDSSESELSSYLKRIEDADYVFFATGGGVEQVPKSLPSDRLFIISSKSFGTSNGIIYAHRNSDDYFKQSIEIDQAIITFNNKMKKVPAKGFVDMMSPVMVDETRVRVFTDDNKFISQDCRHLTQAGARYYSRILDIEMILDMHK